VTLGFVALYAARVRTIERNVEESGDGLGKGDFYRFATTILSLTAVVVALGMSWPVLAALRGGEGAKIEEVLYHKVVVFFFVPAMLAMAVAPFVSWRREGVKAIWNRVFYVFTAALGLTGATLVAMRGPDWGLAGTWDERAALPWGTKIPAVFVVAFLLVLCSFVVVSGLWRGVESMKRAKSSMGGFLAHVGFAVLLGGLVLSRGLERKGEGLVQAGAPARILGYDVVYRDQTKEDIEDRDNKALFDVVAPDGSKFTARPGLFYYEQEGQLKPQVWPHVERGPLHDVYVALHNPVMDLWEQPLKIEPGQALRKDNVTVRFLRSTNNGEFGTEGARFGADLRITIHREGHPDQTFDASPYLTLTADGMQPSFTAVGPDLFAIMKRMDAKTKGIDLQLMFQRPVYPIELFTKPMTNLVWLGTGLMFLGGMASSLSRRARRKRAARVPAAEKPMPFPPTDAPLPTA
jgi:cytochrome c-type biogenesis protein CcmF